MWRCATCPAHGSLQRRPVEELGRYGEIWGDIASNGGRLALGPARLQQGWASPQTDREPDRQRTRTPRSAPTVQQRLTATLSRTPPGDLRGVHGWLFYTLVLHVQLGHAVRRVIHAVALAAVGVVRRSM